MKLSYRGLGSTERNLAERLTAAWQTFRQHLGGCHCYCPIVKVGKRVIPFPCVFGWEQTMLGIRHD